MWNWNPLIGLALLLPAWAYGHGIMHLWRGGSVGRGVARWQVAAFGAGMIALFIALISPVDVLGEQLLSIHMIQHLLLTIAAPPLLVLGAPPSIFLWVLPLRVAAHGGALVRGGRINASDYRAADGMVAARRRALAVASARLVPGGTAQPTRSLAGARLIPRLGAAVLGRGAVTAAAAVAGRCTADLHNGPAQQHSRRIDDVFGQRMVSTLQCTRVDFQPVGD
ncbi:MAG: cytochrome c oxidase assembly protein [Blastochloris sp.]|nr:cytochrome c oxidase assembly protein [Blastochloris sp.]